MARVRVELASREDDAALRALLHRIPMPGAVETLFLREPSFFDALDVEGSHHDVIVARDAGTGGIVGVGTRSVKQAFINGVPGPLGYLSMLRGEEKYRRGTGLARGFRLLREIHGDGLAPIYTTTIIERNEYAIRMLTSGRGGLPVYHDSGRYCCMAISLSLRPRVSAIPDVRVRAATEDDAAAIAEFLLREGPKRQFFPCYDAHDFASTGGRLRGLKAESIFLALRHREIVGVMAAWDQQSFRQNVVTRYAPPLGLFRHGYNVAARVLGYPVLPRPGSTLNQVNLALVCIERDEPEVFMMLLGTLMEHCRNTYSYLMAGMHESDPLLPHLHSLRHFAYYARFFVVCWEDGLERFEALDGRVPYLELGAL